MKAVLFIPTISAFLASVLFSFFLYPGVAGHLESSLVSDRYDDLARGIVSYGTLSYYPQSEPTTHRTPLYPLLLAGAIVLAGDRYVVPALFLQAVLHAITALLTTLMVFRFGDRKTAVIAGLVCALHPALLWFSGRLVIETLSTFLFTLCAFIAIWYWNRPTLARAVLTGVVIGIGLWAKAVFSPLLAAFPITVLLRKAHSHTWRHAAAVFLAGAMLIAPWIIRNYLLTGRWPLIQSVVGINLYLSDHFIDHAGASPFGYAELLARLDYDTMYSHYIEPDSLHSTAWCEARNDAALTNLSLNRYVREPVLFLKKLLLNAVWFWTLGSTPAVSFVMALLQGTLLFFVLLSTVRILRRDGPTGVMLIPLWLVLAYVAAHLPVYALARFSVPLIPALVVVAASGWHVQKRGTTGKN